MTVSGRSHAISVIGPTRPRVSVVIPTFNRAAFLPSAARSALDQTLHEIEVIIVDDGSTDATPDVCRSFAATDPRVRVIRQGNRGLPAARNAGLTAAAADWVAFLDDDDLWVPHALARLRAGVGEGDVVGCLAVAFTSDEPALTAPTILAAPQKFALTPYPPAVSAMPIALHELLLRSFFPIHGALFSTAAVRAVGGFDDTLKAAEDYDLWLRLAARAPVAVLPEALALVRMHPRQMSRVLGIQVAETRRVLERFLSTHPEIHRTGALRRRIARLAREEAYAALRAGQRRAARVAAAHAVRLWPADAKAWLYLLASPSPAAYRALRGVLRGGRGAK